MKARDTSPSLLLASAPVRVLFALGAVAVLWLAVAWALR